MLGNVFSAFMLTTLAGLSTGIGATIAYLIKEPKLKYLSFLLGFSAGVMIYISFVELLGKSITEIGFLTANIAFFSGIGLIYLIDKFVPHFHLDVKPDPFHEDSAHEKIASAGVLTAIGLTLHNFPEGLAVFSVSLESMSLGLPIALAIAIHNIPEGIAVSVPIYYATGDERKAFFYSFYSGLAEPLGAFAGLVFLMPLLNPTILHLILALVAGIMVFISFDELLPISREYGGDHLSTMGLFLGMFVMVISLSVL